MINFLIFNNQENLANNKVKLFFVVMLFLCFDFFLFKTIDLLVHIGVFGVKYSENVVAFPTVSIILFGMCVYAPFEEIIYRLGLKFTPTSFAFVIIGSVSIVQTILQEITKMSEFKPIEVILLLFGYLIIFFITKYWGNSQKANISKFYSKNLNAIFFTSMIIFGFGHYTKFIIIDNLKFIILSPLLFSPYLFMGYFLGLIRLKFGLVWSILLHALVNLTFPLLTYFLFN